MHTLYYETPLKVVFNHYFGMEGVFDILIEKWYAS